MGAVFLGGTTSLPGSVLSVNAATTEHPELAISHAVGGIAVQTAYLGRVRQQFARHSDDARSRREHREVRRQRPFRGIRHLTARPVLRVVGR